MDVSNFFTRLLQPSKELVRTSQPDDLSEFVAAWHQIQARIVSGRRGQELMKHRRRPLSTPMSDSCSGELRPYQDDQPLFRTGGS